MWRSTGRIDRLSKALEFREIDPEKLDIFDLKRTLMRRGVSDTKFCDVCDILLHYLEPPTCQMPHCESHGVDGFCYCCDNLVPSKCKKHRDFLKRCKERANKATDLLLEEVGDRVINYKWTTYQVFTGLEEEPGFEFVEKWSYRLREDVWKEVKQRAKEGKKANVYNIMQ